uniref:Uncharacterized protein LOC111112653 isoform X4 n=1 Tax=Crassostrea virginica TaxID=6565 RepID=A0A8B8BRV7_CRAVI|nr:uncharacterized protein LOC111112653 isoform X4 [Crassostrea virginica]
MAAEESRHSFPSCEESAKYDPVKEAEQFIKAKRDKRCLNVKRIDDIIGKGVFASRDFCEGEFLLEYDGEIISYLEGQRRMANYPERLGSFLYGFTFKKKKYWIDGTYSKQKAKYVNDAGPKTKENNAKMKILEIEGYPHLALFARRKIIKGEEILYDYGGKNLPWRKKEPKTTEKSLWKETETFKVKPCSIKLQRLDFPLNYCTGNAKDFIEMVDAKEQPVDVKDSKEQPGDVKDAKEQPAVVKDAKEQPVDVKDAKEQPVDVKDAKEQPAVVKDAKEQPAVVKNAKEQPVDVKDAKEQPVDVKDSKEQPGDVKDAKEQPVDVKDAKEQPVDVKDAKEQPAVVKDAKEQPVDVKDAKEQPVDVKDAKEQPAVVKDAKEQPAVVKDAKEQPAVVKNAKEQPVDVKDAKEQPVDVKDSKEQPGDVKDSKEQPVDVKDAKEQPVDVKHAKEQPAVVKDAKEQPVDVKDAKEQPVDVKDAKEQPAVVKDAKEQPAVVKNAKEQPVDVKDAKEQPAVVKDAKEQPVDVKDAKEQPAVVKDAKEQPVDVKDAKEQPAVVKDLGSEILGPKRKPTSSNKNYVYNKTSKPKRKRYTDVDVHVPIDDEVDEADVGLERVDSEDKESLIQQHFSERSFMLRKYAHKQSTRIQQKLQKKGEAPKETSIDVGEESDVGDDTEKRIEENEQFIIELMRRTQPHHDHGYTTVFGKKKGIEAIEQIEFENPEDEAQVANDNSQYYGKKIIHPDRKAEPILCLGNVSVIDELSSSGTSTDEASKTIIVCAEEIIDENPEEEINLVEGTEKVGDSGKISLQVENIWSQTSTTDFIIASIFGYNITDRDIKSLEGTHWLTDQVIDAYLKLLCQGEIDKGRPIMHIPVQTMTAICTGGFPKDETRFQKRTAYFSKYLLTSYEIILGVCHQGGNHWTLVVLEPTKGNFYLFDSFGHNDELASRYLLNWSAFLRGKKMEKDVPWILNIKEHTIQSDGYNCGVFCLMFAERFVKNQSLKGIVSMELERERRQIAESLLQHEMYLKDACPCCGLEIPDAEMIPCLCCERSFHKKSYCVGEEYTAEEVTRILCRGCTQKMLVQDIERRSEKKKDEDGQDKFVCGTCGTEFRDMENFLHHKNASCVKKSMNTDSQDDTEFEDSSGITASSFPVSRENENVCDVEKKERPKRPCPFCLKLQSSLTKHLQRCHKNEEEVKSAMILPRPEKNRAFCNLKRQGIFKYNAEIMKSHELDTSSMTELMKERKQSDKELAMCSLCNAFISKSLMHRHAQTCYGARNTTLPPIGVSLKVLKETEYPQDFINFIEKFHLDEVGLVIRNDEFLKKFGLYEFKHQSQSNFKFTEKMNALRSKLRRLARLFIHFKNIALNAGMEIKSCDEIFRTETISLLDEAVSKMTQDSESGEIKSGLKVGLRSLILEVCNSIYLTFSLKLEKQKALEIMEFQQVLKLYWKRYFSAAQENLTNKKQSESRAPRRLPSDDDIKKLNDFIREEVQSIVKDVYTPMTLSLFCKLRNLLTCRLTLFNARRGGEAARLTLAEYNDALSGKWAKENVAGKLDDEANMMCKLKCTYLHSSKKAELVPMIIPKDCWKGLDMLADHENRQFAHIHPSNTFIFANTGSSLDHVNGWQCVRNICEQAKVSRSITATDMRHYVATHYASLDVPQEERDFFIKKHLGHSKFINENVYQCPPAVKEMRVAGKFLTALDSHEVHSGKNTFIDKTDACEDLSNSNNVNEDTCDKIVTRKRRKSDDLENQPYKKFRKEMNEHTEVDVSDDESESDAQSIHEEIINTWSRKTSKVQPRHQWSKEEDTAIQQFFAEEISDVSQRGNKGTLNIDGKIKQFINQHPQILLSFTDSEKKKKIRVKIINCRRRTREVYFKNLHRLKN